MQPPSPDATTPIALEFELTHDDMVDASMAVARRSRSLRIVSTGLLAGTSVLLFGLALSAGTVASSSMMTALVAVIGFAGFQKLIVPRIQREQVSAANREGRNLFLTGKQMVVIDENGVTASNWVMQTHVRWPGIERIVVTDKHLLLYYGAARALVVPRRAFGSEESMQAFIASAERRRVTALEATRAAAAAALPPGSTG